MNPNSAALNPSEPIKNNKKLGKCPFRKRTYFMASSDGKEINAWPHYSEFMEEEFCDCIGEKCMLYNQRLGCLRAH